VLASCASHSEPSRLDVALEVSAQVHYQVGFASLELDLEVGGELWAAGVVGGGPSLVAGSRSPSRQVRVPLRDDHRAPGSSSQAQQGVAADGRLGLGGWVWRWWFPP